MRKILLIATTLLISTNTVSSQEKETPFVFDGVWSGIARLDDDESKRSFPVKITIRNKKYSIEYPSLGCGGELHLKLSSSNFMDFREKLTYGKSNCESTKKIAINIHKDNSVHFHWFGSTGLFSSEKNWALGELTAANDQQRLTEQNKVCIKTWWGNEYERKTNGERIGPYPKTIECITPIAEAGGIEAQKRLGRIYYNGADKNVKLSMYWYLQAINQGDVSPYQSLGMLYLNKGDYDNSIKWHTKAVELNDDDANYMYPLAEAYRKKGDFKTAFELHVIAMKLEKGYGSKQKSSKALSEMYSRGEGIEKDKVKSYMWGKVSTTYDSAYSHDSTLTLMNNLKLSILEKYSAKDSAKKCIDSGYNDC